MVASGVVMEECLQPGKHERSEQRLGYRRGYYRRRLITRVGKLVLRVPQAGRATSACRCLTPKVA